MEAHEDNEVDLSRDVVPNKENMTRYNDITHNYTTTAVTTSVSLSKYVILWLPLKRPVILVVMMGRSSETSADDLNVVQLCIQAQHAYLKAGHMISLVLNHEEDSFYDRNDPFDDHISRFPWPLYNSYPI